MKNLRIVSLLIVMLMLLTTAVYAADSFNLRLVPNVTTANPGNTITIGINLANLNVTGGEQGVGGYQAKLVYDSEILEFSKVESSTWEVDCNENNLIAYTKDGQVVKTETQTATLTFKVKETAEEGKTTIQLQNIEGATPDTIERN